jgi:hypothetical protein
MLVMSGAPARRIVGAALGVAVASAGVAVASCGAPNVVGSPAAHAGSPRAASARSASPAASGPFAPLTGVPVPAAVAARPAVALAIAGADPAGLQQADVVYEEITTPIRYLAVFQSREATGVGPVTGTRPADGMIVSVLHAAVGYSGGTPGFVAVLDHQHVIDMGAATHASLYSDGPDGVTTATARFRGSKAGPPPELFPFRGEGVLTSRELASSGTWRPTSLRIAIPGAPGQRWRYDAAAQRWRRTAGGPAVSVANLIVQTVPYKTVYLSHRYGITAPSARVFGHGPAVVLSSTADTPARGPGGLAVHATWSKPASADLTDFVDSRQAPIEFAPGNTWIILAPPGTTLSTGGGKP